MFITRKETFGNIEIEKSFFVNLLKYSLKKYNNIVWPANKKGKIVDPIIMSDSLENYGNDGELKIRVYLIYKFGVSIKETTSDFVDEFSKTIIQALGELPSEITVCIVGIKSKQIARRQINIKHKIRLSE